MTKSDFIFMLVRSALWKQPLEHFDMTPWEYKAVMEDAEKQCVVGLITDCLRSNNMGLKKKCVIHMLKLQKALNAENQLINSNLDLLLQLMERHGVHPVVVKGQTIGAHYPNPNLRVPGDIDFYVSHQEFETALQALGEEWLEKKVTIQDVKRKEYGFEYLGTKMELHKYLVIFANKKIMSYFDHLVETSEHTNVKVGNTDVPTMEPTFNILYTFCHLYHHFIMEGVAVRQLCDMAILIHTQKDSIDKERLSEMLKNTSYTNAFKAFGSILVNKIGLPAEDFPFELKKKDYKRGEKVLKEILRCGNWGVYGRKTHELNLKFTLETGKIVISHCIKFFRLSPRENLSLLTRYVPKRIKEMFKRMRKKK